MKKQKKITERDFRLLLSFLGDENERTVSLAKKQLEGVVKKHPRYRKLAENASDPSIRNLAHTFLEEVRYRDLEPAFQKLASERDKLDLEKGAILLSKVEYPHLKTKDVTRLLDDMAKNIDHSMRSLKPVPTRSVNAMRHTLFDDMGFIGNKKNYYDPDNTYINKVLQRKLGIPISLSCIYLFVAKRLNLTVHGVGLPGHFLVGHRVPRGVIFIDPYNGGRILRAKDCEVLVRRNGAVFKQAYLDPAPHHQILARMITNLIAIYHDQGNTQRAHWLAQIFQTLQ